MTTPLNTSLQAQKQPQLQHQTSSWRATSCLALLSCSSYVSILCSPTFGCNTLSKRCDTLRLHLCKQKFKEESLVFQEKILARSGLGQQTCLPPAVSCLPPCPSMSAAREEFETVMFTTVEQLLQKTGGCGLLTMSSLWISFIKLLLSFLRNQARHC